MRRSASEWAGLFVAFVVGGAAVTFGVVIIGSFLNLPHAALWAAGVVGLAAIAYPMFRSSSRSGAELTGDSSTATDREV